MMLYLDKKKSNISEIIKEIPTISNITFDKNIIEITIDNQKGIWGFGERFDALDQTGKIRVNKVYEKFTNQGENTYLPIPFALLSDFGIFINTEEIFKFFSTKINFSTIITIELPSSDEEVFFFPGKPSYQLKQLFEKKGNPILPPSWSFGPWMSANRWNSQETVLKQAEKSQELGMFHSVLVIEAWSDEATFYLFNDNNLWPNPEKMIKELKEKGIHLILWQTPVLKKLEKGRRNSIHEEDCRQALEKGLVVKNKDGSVYTIPEGRWFAGSMVPDFTNAETCKWWFEKRQYLLDMGVDGFKTDGGEFIYDSETQFFDGRSGKEMINSYPLSYTTAYFKAIGKERVLFSRAGYTGSWTSPMHWAGDQFSTWEEFRHVLTAGLNASVSGIFFWGFDIAGFAGPLPKKDLYLRAFTLSAFVPVMQWHSEPIGGQFSEIMKSEDEVNDRSPWNIAHRNNDDSIIKVAIKYTQLRKRLMPYIYNEAEYCVNEKIPLMQPLFFNWPQDDVACKIDDEFLFGSSLLIAPILEEGKTSRKIYLPEGNWFDVQEDLTIKGNTWLKRDYNLDSIGVFINLDKKNPLLEGVF